MIDGYGWEDLPDGLCFASDTIFYLQEGLYRSLDSAVELARQVICSGLYLTDEEEEFLIRFVFNATGVNHGS